MCVSVKKQKSFLIFVFKKIKLRKEKRSRDRKKKLSKRRVLTTYEGYLAGKIRIFV